LNDYIRYLASLRTLPKALLTIIETIPYTTHPMVQIVS
jgi:hypothetical protein